MLDRQTRQVTARCVSTLLSALLIVMCAACIRPHTIPGSTDADVYAVVLDSLFRPPRSADGARIVLDDSTAAYVREKLVPEFWTDLQADAGVSDEIVKDFEERSRIPHPLNSIETALRSRLKRPVQVIDHTAKARLAAMRDSIVKRGERGLIGAGDAYWRAFYQVYPRSVGHVVLSPIGYDRAGRVGVLYVKRGCGMLCGDVRLVVVRRVRGRWHVARVVLLGVS